jgi:hypothetical protein
MLATIQCDDNLACHGACSFACKSRGVGCNIEEEFKLGWKFCGVHWYYRQRKLDADVVNMATWCIAIYYKQC